MYIAKADSHNEVVELSMERQKLSAVDTDAGQMLLAMKMLTDALGVAYL